MNKNVFKLIVIIFTMQLTLSGCENNDTEILCIEPPSGSALASKTNITLFTQNTNISAAVIIINDEEKLLSLDGWDITNNKNFTCWQTIPDLNGTNTVVFGYKIGDKEVFGSLNASNITTKNLVIEIKDENAEIKDYVSCND